MNVTAEQLHADLDTLGETAMKIKRERDKLFAFAAYVTGLAEYCHELEQAGMVDRPFHHALNAASGKAKALVAEIGGAQ